MKRSLLVRIVALLLPVWAAAPAAIVASEAAAQAQSQIAEQDPDRLRIERIVREYLLANPELMIEVMRRLEAKQQDSQAQAFQEGLDAVRDQLFADEAAPVIGNPNGKTVIVEFSDYNCPYCRQMMPIVDQAATRNGDLKVILREFPILGPSSNYAAAAALAANRQDRSKYGELHRRLFETKGQLTEAKVDEILSDLGFDMDAIRSEMKSPEVASAINRNHQIAQRLGINGTPAFIAGGRLVPGAISPERFEELVVQAAPAD